MKDYLLKLYPKDPRSAEMMSSYLETVGHDSTSTKVRLDQLKAVLSELLKDFDKGVVDYEDLAILCDKLEILSRDTEGYRESRVSSLIAELSDIDWVLRDKNINPREHVKSILLKHSI